MRRVRAAAAVALVLGSALGWVLVAGTPAAAHAELLATDPANGVRLARAPAQVALRFNEAINPVRGATRLLDAAGRPAGNAEATVVPGQSRVLSLPVPAALPAGAYVVTWRVLSADGHPVGGFFAFSVGADGTPPPGSPPTSPSGAGTGPDSRGLDPAFWAVRGLGYAALALLGGGVLFLLLCWPAGVTDRRARRLVTAGWIAGLVASAGALLLQGVWVAGAPLTRALDPDLVAATLGTGFGRFVAARLVLFAAAGAVLAGAWTRRRLLVAAPVLAALPVTWAGTGHARAGTDVPAAVVADLVHLAAMAAWIGGLILLAACVLPARRVSTGLGVLPRFSRLAMGAIAALVLTGAYQAWRELRGTELTGSPYARLLLFKVAAFGLLLCLGAASRSLVRYRYVRPAAQAVRARGRGDRDAERAALRLLSRSVRLEVGIAVAVLGLTAGLVATAPGGHQHPAAPSPGYQGPYSAVLPLTHGGDVRVIIDPARPGPNRLVLSVRTADGARRDVPDVTARLRLGAFGADAMPVPLTRAGPGQFVAPAVPLPSAGSWLLEVRVRTGEITEEAATAQVSIF